MLEEYKRIGVILFFEIYFYKFVLEIVYFV